MLRCILCLEEKSPLTDEHVIYAALGGGVVLKKTTCEECQRQPLVRAAISQGIELCGSAQSLSWNPWKEE